MDLTVYGDLTTANHADTAAALMRNGWELIEIKTLRGSEARSTQEFVVTAPNTYPLSVPNTVHVAVDQILYILGRRRDVVFFELGSKLAATEQERAACAHALAGERRAHKATRYALYLERIRSCGRCGRCAELYADHVGGRCPLSTTHWVFVHPLPPEVPQTLYELEKDLQQETR